MSGCPFLQGTLSQAKASPHQEFSAIRTQYPLLSSTGCTTNFCQSGRMTHTDEDRVGRNRPYEQVREEAVDFLRQMHLEGLFSSLDAFHVRVREVLEEIEKSSKPGRFLEPGSDGPEVAATLTEGLVGGTWTQTHEELEFGIRQAWKHARRCIMRSEYKTLRSASTTPGFTCPRIYALLLTYGRRPGSVT